MVKCEYGCKQKAKYETKQGKKICSEYSTQCPINKEKNSNGTKKTYQQGRVPFFALEESRKFKKWRKGKLDEADFSYGTLRQLKGNHKAVLIEERGYECESCSISYWLGKKIVLEMDHIDGNGRNNFKENLKLLCPNCHSQTSTWRRKKTKKQKKCSDYEMIKAIKSSENLSQTLNKLSLKWGSGGTIMKIMSDYNLTFKMPE